MVFAACQARHRINTDLNITMNTISLLLIGTFLISMLTGFCFIPFILNFCRRNKLYDIPDERKVHHAAIPRLGGISFLPSMLLAAIIMLLTYENITGDQKIVINQWTASCMISLLIIYAVGIVDDIVGVQAKIKFMFQIIAASLLPISGLYINNLYGFCGIYEIPFAVGFPLTVLCIAFIDNAMNLIDGIDGLAAGLAFIALGGFLYGFYCIELYIYCILIAGLMGILLAYMYYNIFGNPEKGLKIFMGDSGSLTIGFMLSFFTIKFAMSRPDLIPCGKYDITLFCSDMPYEKVCLAFAYSLMIVPTFDVFRVIIVRMKHHTPIFNPDKRHIHHKFLAIGLNQHQTLVSILSLQLAYIIINLAMIPYVCISLIVLIDIILFIAINMVMTRIINKKQAAKN